MKELKRLVPLILFMIVAMPAAGQLYKVTITGGYSESTSTTGFSGRWATAELYDEPGYNIGSLYANFSRYDNNTKIDYLNAHPVTLSMYAGWYNEGEVDTTDCHGGEMVPSFTFNGCGTYSYSVNDCGESATIDFTIEPLITISGTKGAYCASQSVTLNGSPGFTSYTWYYKTQSGSWQPITTTTNSSVALTAYDIWGTNYGSYMNQNIYFTYTIGGCTSINAGDHGPFVFTPDQVTAVFSTSDPICIGEPSGQETGAISIASYNRSPIPGEVFSFEVHTSPDLQPATLKNSSALSAGNYYAVVYSNYGCGSLTFVPQTIGTGPRNALNASASITSNYNGRHVKCAGYNDGQITISATGGNGTYSYSLDGTTFQPLNTFNVGAGTYGSITVKDGCTPNTNVKVTNSIIIDPTPSITISSATPSYCNGTSNGQISVSASGGTGTLMYSSDGTNFQTSNIFTGLPTGITYTITVRDVNLCTATTTAYVPAPITGTISHTNPGCNGNTNGTITITGASGGTAPLQYSIDGTNFQSSNVFNGLSAGDYTVTIRDANGCTTTGTRSLLNPAPITASASSVAVTCSGGTNGSITVSASGGTGAFAYSITGINGTYQASNVFSGLSSGSYTVHVKDQNSCTSSVAASVGTPSPITTNTPSITHVSCFNGSNGSITVSASGGTAPLAYSRNGTTFQSSNIFNGLTAGTYTITVRDQNACTSTFNATINQPATSITASGSATSVTCNGESNGSLTVSASGGTPGYNYSKDGITFQPGNVFTGLTAGTYNITVRDQNNCTASFNIAITQPPTITASASSVSHVTCNGGNNGSVTVSASGGTGTLFYSKDGSNFQSNNVLTGFTAGSYTVTVRDQNSCLQTFNTTINQPSAISATTSTTAVSCFGGSDGSITVSASNGVPPLSYALNAGSFQSSNVFTGYAAATYVVTIRDANSCSITRNATISEPVSVTGSIAISAPVNCNGQSNGALNLTPSGGTLPYTFNWSHGATTEDVTGLAAGNYSVQITDSKGCQTTVNHTLIQPAVLAISYTLSNYNGSPISCNAAANGSINATISGGTSPYTYAWSNGSNTEDISGLTAGTYTLTVTDNRGCITSLPITLMQPQPVSASISSQSNVLCFGGNNGSVTVSAAGGTGSYNYSINGGSTWQASPTFPNLTAGSYTVTTRDVNNCTGTTPVAITSPSALGVNLVSKQDTQCGQSNGTAQVSGTGGVASYTYRWRNASAVIIGTAATISNLTSGTYTAEITDQNGCISSLPVTINSSNGPTVTITSSTPASCANGNNGSATISISGGSAPYTILWPNGQTGYTATNLSATTHMVQITDNTGCAGSYPVTITSPPALAIQATTLKNPSCFGDSNGIIEITATGGTPPYSYSWSSGQTSTKIENRPAGTYTVTVTDNVGCQLTIAFTLTDPPVLTVQTIASVNPSCVGSSNGSIQVSGSGGNGSYTYLWSTGQTSSQISNLLAGQYTITVTDQLGCQVSQQITLSNPPALVLQFPVVQHPSCFGFTNGNIQVSASGGTGAYTYQWTTGANGNTLSGVGAGTYGVTVTDNLGCTSSSSTTLVQPAALSVSTVSTQNPSCGGANNGRIDVSATGGTAPYTYQWNNGSTGSNVITFIAGTHTVTVTDQQGCTVSLAVTLTQPPALTVQEVNVQNPVCFGATNGFIETSSSGGTGQHTFLWNTGSTSNLLNSIPAGTYSLTVTDQNGCSTSGQYTVTNPVQLKVDLGPDKTICPGQSVTVNPAVDNVSSQWSGPNGFTSTSQQITTAQPGIYLLRITDANGCQAEDNFLLTVSNQLLEADLLMVSQAHAGDTVIVIDISWPLPESITWNFGTKAKIIYEGQDYALLTYNEPGFYNVTVSATLGGCQNSYTQGIEILKRKDPEGGRQPQHDAIVEYTVHPNPFRDNFELNVLLSRPQSLTVQMIHLGTNAIVLEDELEENIHHRKEFTFGNLAAGVYVLMIKSGKEIKSIRLLRL